MSTEPALMSLTAVAKAIVKRQFSSREVTRSCLDRIVQWQTHLNAFMAVEADAALVAAEAADTAFAKGRSRGALHGVPMAHKDMYYRKGEISTGGSDIRKDWRAPVEISPLR